MEAYNFWSVVQGPFYTELNHVEKISKRNSGIMIM